MRRRTFDTLMSAGGVVLTIVLLVSGALLMVGANFANDNVSKQLSAQKIFFPKADSEGLKDPKIGPFINKYAGQQLTTGAQAEAYANHYIAVHIAEYGRGQDLRGARDCAERSAWGDRHGESGQRHRDDDDPRSTARRGYLDTRQRLQG